MSLNYSSQCPLLGPGDVLRLHASMHYSDTRLIDTVTGAEHTFHRSADTVFSALHQGSTVAQLYKLPNPPSEHISELLGFCNSIGALVVRRSVKSKIQLPIKRLHSLLFGIVYATDGRRYPTHIIGITAAVLQASKALALTSVGVSLLMCAAIPDKALTITYTYIWAIGLFVGSIIAHEFGHVHILARRKYTAVMLQHGSHVMVLHRRAASEKLVALAGPIFGILYTFLCGLPLSLFHVAFAAPLACFVLLTHCISLLPFYADGRSLHYYKHLSRWRSS